MNRRMIIAAGLVTAALLGAYAIWLPEGAPLPIERPASPAASTSEATRQRAGRITRMMLENPALGRDEASKLAERSDRMEAELEATGKPDVRRMLRGTRVSEAEARAYFDEHRAVFGGRSFEASRLSIDRLVAIERVSAELDVE